MNKKLIISLIIFAGIALDCSQAADYYPEMGYDPFYSSLNPAYMNLEETTDSADDTLINLFKKNKKEKKEKKENAVVDENNSKSADILDKSTETETVKEKHNSKFKSKFLSFFGFEDEEDDENNSEITKSENNILNNTDNEDLSPKEKFIRPEKDSDFVKELEKEEREKNKQAEPDVPLIKKIKFWEKQDNKNEKSVENKEPDVELTADYMEYYPDRYEVEAVGNARVNFKGNEMSLSANKIIFNYDKNVLKAKDNVVLMSSDAITEGDFIRIDLNKPDGFMENPVTVSDDIKLKAKEAFVYSDRIEQVDGVAKVLKNETLKFGTTSFSGYVDPGQIFSRKLIKDYTCADKGVYSLKAKTIYIDAKTDHEVITIKNADLYLKNRKIAVIPSAKIVSNKERTFIESNLPEFGSMSMLGSHIGPAVVLNVPGGSTLKLAPIITYSDDKIGIGGIARFRNEYNMTEVAYGTSKDKLLVRGRHKLAPGLTLNYSKLTNQSDWFLGYRRPKYGAQLNYTRSDYISDLKLNFAQKYSAGAFVDYEHSREDRDFRDTEGKFGWMTQTYKPLYKFSNEEGNIGLNVALIAQTVARAYTTGDVQGIFRIGPALNTKVGPWEQSLIYYQSAIGGNTPFEFDRYRYGRSNFVFIESLRISKYVSIGYLGSLAMNRDVRSDDMLQENRILLSLGPDYAKFTLGYDSVRNSTMFKFSMLVGTEDSEIKFDRGVMQMNNEPGKKKKSERRKDKRKYRKIAKELDKSVKENEKL